MTAESPSTSLGKLNPDSEELLPPKVRYLVNWCYLFYLRRNRKPRPDEVWADNQGLYSSPLEVATLFDTRGFKRCINLRGIYWVNDKNLTSEQMYAIAYITDPGQTGTLKARLAKIGIKYNTWRAWMANSVFKHAFNEVASKLLEDNFHEVDRGLLSSAARGDINAIKFAYEITGRYDPARKQALDVAAVLARVVEIISTHVKDPETLQAIGGDLTMLSAGQGIRPVAAIEGTDYIVNEPVLGREDRTPQNRAIEYEPEGGSVFGHLND